MTLYFAEGSPTTVIDDEELNKAIQTALQRLGQPDRVLAVPPDFTRFHSRAGQITCLLYQTLRERLTDVMPALGTHFPMEDWQLERMFPDIPRELIREHRWRDDVVTIG